MERDTERKEGVKRKIRLEDSKRRNQEHVKKKMPQEVQRNQNE